MLMHANSIPYHPIVIFVSNMYLRARNVPTVRNQAGNVSRCWSTGNRVRPYRTLTQPPAQTVKYLPSVRSPFDRKPASLPRCATIGTYPYQRSLPRPPAFSGHPGPFYDLEFFPGFDSITMGAAGPFDGARLTRGTYHASSMLSAAL